MNIRSQKMILELNTGMSVFDELSLIKDAIGLIPKHVFGCYKGIKNNAYIVSIRDTNEFKLVMSLANHYDQESVLYVDSNGLASLEYMNGTSEVLGVFKAVDSTAGLDAYTTDPDTGLNYTA